MRLLQADARFTDGSKAGKLGSLCQHCLHGPVVKASPSRVADPAPNHALPVRLFRSLIIPVTSQGYSGGYPGQTPGVTGSVPGLVGPVLACCGWQTWDRTQLSPRGFFPVWSSRDFQGVLWWLPWPDAWIDRVSTRTGRPGVSVLCLGETAADLGPNSAFPVTSKGLVSY